MPSATTDGGSTRPRSTTPRGLDVDTIVLDVDGTLIDSNYHHVQAWATAFKAVGRAVPLWRIHRAIGMGGDRLVTEVAGDSTEHAVGDEVRAQHDEAYEQRLGQVGVLPGGHELISTLRAHGYRVVAASSGTAEQTQAALDKIDDAHELDGWVCGDDVSTTKPDPALLTAALEKVGGESAAAIGDSVWDMVAAGRLGWHAVGLRCGGFAHEELVEAGADAVYDDPADFMARSWPAT